jgi:hypothetical protein
MDPTSPGAIPSQPMRTAKTILLAIAIPALLVLVGVGPTASAAIPKPGTGPSCFVIFCPGNTVCIDTPTGGKCVTPPVKP